MLPPGLSAADFTAALTAFRGVVGADWVFTSDEDVATYRDHYSPLRDLPGERVASAAVAPADVEQVQQLVRIANRYRVPLYPISTGRNLGYGGSAPAMSGSVVLDLKRMNRILNVDPVRNFALVEPGVSYFDLYDHIRAKGYKLWIDCPETGWGSPIGNAIDRGWGYTAGRYRDHFGSHCGMEVVMPDGTLLRTGMGGAGEGVYTWQDFPTGFGPSLDGMFSQANYGIVTKMGFWLMPEPEGVLTTTLTVPRYADLVPLVEQMAYLQDSGIVNGMPQYSSSILGNLVRPTDPVLIPMIGRKGGADTAGLDAYAKGRPYWTLHLVFYGPPAVTRAQWDHCRDRITRAIPGTRIGPELSYTPPLSQQAQDAMSIDMAEDRLVTFGIPNLQAFFVGGRTPQMPTGAHGHMWAAPILPRDGAAMLKAQNVYTRLALDMGVTFGGSVPMPLTYSDRAFVTFVPLLVTDDAEQNAKSVDMMRRIIDVGAEHGWYEYRGHVLFQDYVMNQFAFGDHSFRKTAEAIKDALDPQGVVAPGRYGIWPRHLREKRA